MFKSENIRTLIKVLFVISCIVAVAMVIYGIALIAAGDYLERTLGAQILIIGIFLPLSSYLSLYALYALSQIESNTAATNKKLDRLIKHEKSQSSETRGSDWGSFMTEEEEEEEEKEDEEERPAPLHDEFGRF